MASPRTAATTGKFVDLSDTINADGCPMHKTPEITRLIHRWLLESAHENLWIVISFAFGQPAIAKFVDARFKGEWKYLNKTIYERAEIRADRALLEMATQLRVLDDAEQLNSHFTQTMGVVIQGDGSKTDLHFRDLTNKIMHAEKFEWELSFSRSRPNREF